MLSNALLGVNAAAARLRGRARSCPCPGAGGPRARPGPAQVFLAEGRCCFGSRRIGEYKDAYIRDTDRSFSLWSSLRLLVGLFLGFSLRVILLPKYKSGGRILAVIVSRALVL